MKKQIIYVVEPFDWSIKWDGTYITSNIRRLYRYPAKIIFPSRRRMPAILNRILHFGSRNVFLPEFHNFVNPQNNLIMTWFHGTEKDTKYINALPEASKKLDVIHTSCSISKKFLVEHGVDKNKIIVIPLGVDTGLFKKASEDEKEKIRHHLKIPGGSIVIGSFQKDGTGWNEGNEPKYEKGPDIFCRALKLLKEKKYPVFALLTGPARGYVKKMLTEFKIPFAHYYLKNYLNIVKYYNALDAYMISSRAEGGPKAILECFATGIPVVSTSVGMVNDIGRHGENVMISGIDDFETLASNMEKIINDQALRRNLAARALDEIKDFDWAVIAQKYFENIYIKFI